MGGRLLGTEKYTWISRYGMNVQYKDINRFRIVFSKISPYQLFSLSISSYLRLMINLPSPKFGQELRLWERDCGQTLITIGERHNFEWLVTENDWWIEVYMQMRCSHYGVIKMKDYAIYRYWHEIQLVNHITQSYFLYILGDKLVMLHSKDFKVLVHS